MFQKYNFTNILIFSIILAYTLVLTHNVWWYRPDTSFSGFIVNMLVAALGGYSLFVENEFLKTKPYYQVFITALITGYQSIDSIEHNINWRFRVYVHYLNLAWALLSLLIFAKFPNFLVKIFRFDIGYTVFFLVLRHIPYVHSYSEIVSAILSIGFIFINYLTFEKIAIYSSICLYSYMIAKGFLFIITLLPFYIDYYQQFYIVNSVAGTIFVASTLYFHYKQNSSQAILLGSEQTGYNTIRSESE